MKKYLFLALFLLACPLWAVPIRIITTADMHGYLLPRLERGNYYGGAAELLAYWKQHEGYRPEQFLTIACGDTSTAGPAISYLLRGAPTMDAMNLMGYDVCALGNHEFDLTVNGLKDWQQQAKFPFISANLAMNGKPWDGVPPYVIVEQDGVKVGIIGLSTLDIEEMSDRPGAVSMADALRKYVPEMRAKGAQFIIVAAHEGAQELAKVAEEVKDLRIPLWLAGHWHEMGSLAVYAERSVSYIVSSGDWFDSYARIDMDVDPKTGAAELLSCKQVTIRSDKPMPADKALAARIAYWKERTMKAELMAVPTVTIPWLAKAPVIDGKVDAAEWGAAAGLDTFWVPAGNGKRAEPPTQVLLGIDNKNLYLAARCTLIPGVEPTAKSTARDTDQWQDDSIELFVWPDERNGRFVQFIVNAAGSLLDTENLFDPGSRMNSDVAWNPNYTVKTGREEKAWTLEMAIPLEVAGLTAKPGAAFRLNLNRNIIEKEQRYASWSPLPVPSFHVPPYFGKAVIGQKP
ncbi:MAG: metallophosphoesterase [Armatimonadota bacterium]